MTNKNLGPQIRALRGDGLSYKQIQAQLGCSLGTISYHLGDGQKSKSADRRRALRRTVEGALGHKTAGFQRETVLGPPRMRAEKPESTRKAQQRKTRDFSRDTDREFGWEDVLRKIGESPSCYLTGDPVDLTQTSTYELDHIYPRSLGGSNSLDNLGLASKEANRAKGILTLEEFVTLCRKVVHTYDTTHGGCSSKEER